MWTIYSIPEISEMLLAYYHVLAPPSERVYKISLLPDSWAFVTVSTQQAYYHMISGGSTDPGTGIIAYCWLVGVYRIICQIVSFNVMPGFQHSVAVLPLPFRRSVAPLP